MSRAKSVWALFAALAAGLLAFQLFTHTAPMTTVAHEQTTTSQGEAVFCEEDHGPEETVEHNLTRERQRADEQTPGGRERGVGGMGSHVAAESAASSPRPPALRLSRPVRTSLRQRIRSSAADPAIGRDTLRTTAALIPAVRTPVRALTRRPGAPLLPAAATFPLKTDAPFVVRPTRPHGTPRRHLTCNPSSNMPARSDSGPMSSPSTPKASPRRCCSSPAPTPGSFQL